MPLRRKRLTLVTEPALAGQEITLYPSVRSWMLVLLISLAFCATSPIVIPRNPWMGWCGLAFFGIGTLLSLVHVFVPGASYLRLASDGFYIKSLFRTHFTRWQDVSYFSDASISMNAMAVFNFAPSYTGQKFGRTLARDIAGWEGALSDTYGMSAPELANLMNQWKARSDSLHNAQTASGDSH